MIQSGPAAVARKARSPRMYLLVPQDASYRSSEIDPSATNTPSAANVDSAQSGDGAGQETAPNAADPHRQRPKASAASTQAAARRSPLEPRVASVEDSVSPSPLTSRVLADPPDLPPFEEIVRHYHRDVRLYVARHLGREAAVDDVSQEVFVQVYRSLDQFAGRGSLRAWILGIARHCLGTWFRQQNRQIRFRTGDFDLDLAQYHWHQRPQSADKRRDPSTDECDTERELHFLQECLTKLKPPQRTLIQQFYFEQVTAEAIAQQQGRGAGGVRMALLRIREALAKCVRQQLARRSTHEQ